jgi:hypothetical protein
LSWYLGRNIFSVTPKSSSIVAMQQKGVMSFDTHHHDTTSGPTLAMKFAARLPHRLQHRMGHQSPDSTPHRCTAHPRPSQHPQQYLQSDHYGLTIDRIVLSPAGTYITQTHCTFSIQPSSREEHHGVRPRRRYIFRQSTTYITLYDCKTLINIVYMCLLRLSF